MHFLPTQQQENWIKTKVESGDYANASEVVREAIREKMERDRIKDAKLQDLRAAIEEGDKSGEAFPLDIEELITNSQKRWASRKNNQTGQPD